MKKWIAVSLALFLLVGAVCVLPIHGEGEIYDNVIRLHVLANSDSEQDQALKLTVRDAVLAYTAPLLENVHDRATAEQILAAHTEQIDSLAEQTLRDAGSPAPVRVTLSHEYYPRRSYEAIALPAGEYLSLRVQIGSASGGNWWCVLFPPLCVTAASSAQSTCLAAGLSKEQYQMIAGTEQTKYRVRFKLVEVFEQLFG